MNKNAYKKSIQQILPDDDFEKRLQQKLAKKQPKWKFKFIGSIVVSAIVLGSFFSFGINFLPKQKYDTKQMQDFVSEPIHIPKIQLPDHSMANAKMVGLIVYKAKIYTLASSTVNSTNAKSLLDEKLGTTKGTIDEWSTQDDYSKELASTIGETDVYSVKGYSSDFRIMTYQENEGNIYSDIYECLNGITLTRGSDLFGEMNLSNNVSSAKWESFDSWNESKNEFQDITIDEDFTTFVEALYDASPLLDNESIITNKWKTGKIVTFILKDGSTFSLRLFPGGYISYSNSVLFKMNDTAFSKILNKLTKQ